MTFSELESVIDKDGNRSTKENLDAFNVIISKLGPLIHGDHCFCGPHSYLPMRLAIDVAKPKRILEIGFNLGHSALFWLLHAKASVVSVDIRMDERMRRNANVCAEHGDFRFIHRKTPDIYTLKPGQFDMAFIDGSHEYKDVAKDIAWCRELKIPYLHMDDWLTIYGGVQQAIFESGLKIIFTSGNQVMISTEDNYPILVTHDTYYRI